MKDEKGKEDSKKKAEKVIPKLLQAMKTHCKKHYSKKDNQFHCDRCTYENVCSVIQFNGYPIHWDLRKMSVKF